MNPLISAAFVIAAGLAVGLASIGPASSFYKAQTEEFILKAEELLKLRETLTKVYVQGRANLYGLYLKTWKETFLCQQQKPKLMELLIL